MADLSSFPVLVDSAEPGFAGMQTRFIALEHNDPATLLPYLLPAIEAVGRGSIVVVRSQAASARGLQITLPPDALEFVTETINRYEGKTPASNTPIPLDELAPYVILKPIIKTTKRVAEMKAIVLELGLCPASMKVTAVVLNETGGGALIVSGPADLQVEYTSSIQPVLQSLVADVIT